MRRRYQYDHPDYRVRLPRLLEGDNKFSRTAGSTNAREGENEMITLIGECKNCGKIYGNKVIGTLESIYNQDTPHKCEGERE